MKTAAVDHVVGEYGLERPGPTVVAIGGLHGNEPAGLAGIQCVLDQMASRRVPLRGRFVGLRGNLAALRAGRRYLARDLNRGWDADSIARLLAQDEPRSEEDREQLGLLHAVVPLLLAARQPLVFLDLHSTSGPGAPFVCMADVLRNRPIAFALPAPLILGLEEMVQGALLGYLCDLGHVAVAVEGGQQGDPGTQRRHEASLWLGLVAAGALDRDDVPDFAAQRTVLADAARNLPAAVEVRHRHATADGDGFEMLPGFENFGRLRAGQPVARDRSGVVRAPAGGYMLMPRYQSQGDDGFFVARRVSKRWLTLSALLRRARLDRLVPLLPGVARHTREPDRFLVDPRVARMQVRNLFHLFGYRQMRAPAGRLLFARRRPDFHALQELPVELRALGEREAPLPAPAAAS